MGVVAYASLNRLMIFYDQTSFNRKVVVDNLARFISNGNTEFLVSS